MRADAVIEQSAVPQNAGMSKVARYNWLSRNAPGDLRYVSKHALQVDHSYQRQLNESKRLRIASDFNWAAFGVLIVVLRDGILWVIDGQHRLAAALSRDDISEVPVVVFVLEGGVKDEAQDFLVANRDRKALSGIEKFKAMVMSGDPHAAIAKEMVEGSGRIIGREGSDSVRCISAVIKALQTDTPTMQRIWPLVSDLSQGKPIDNRLILGMFTLERRLLDEAGSKRSLCELDNRRKLLAQGHGAVMRAIGDAAAYYERGGDVVFARGILKLINHGRRNRLAIRGDKADA